MKQSQNHWVQTLAWAENRTFLGGVEVKPGMANLIEGQMSRLAVLVILGEEAEC